jgi:hypothetical protein
MEYFAHNSEEENLNNIQEGYDNQDYYYLTEENNGLSDNVYRESNFYEHMDPVAAPSTAAVAPTKKDKYKSKGYMKWTYIYLIIIVIAIVMYYLIDQKMITLPESLTGSSSFSFGSSSSPSSPFNTLGSTFMSLH